MGKPATPPSSSASAPPPMEQIKAAMRTAWTAGDFGVIARSNTVAAEQFVARLPVAPGSRTLDVATGTGNVALPLARRGAVVTGLDLAPNLLDQARERAAGEHLTITFDEGDAEQLPYPDASFDLVTTMFGAMFAPWPELVAAEFARVLKPGGLLAMANWNPESFSGRMFALGARHNPPPRGLPAPVLWGEEAVVRERLSGKFSNIQTTLIPLSFDLPTDPAGAVKIFTTYFGPTVVAYNRLDTAGKEALSTELEQLWTGANTAPDAENHTVVPNEYLQVLATRNATSAP